jgi:hypothetical protein
MSPEMKSETVTRTEILTLRLDSKRDWLLLEARCRETVNEKISEETDVREYGDSVDGVPMLIKRTITRQGQDSLSTEEMEVIRFDPTPADEAVFHEDSLPLSVPKAKATSHLSVEQRIRRHLMLAVCWLIVPLLVILWPKRKNTPMKDKNEDEVVMA